MPRKHRQLAAIVFTDIVGYSKMMREDEQKANDVRERHREIFDRLTPEYGGKILQYYGDGTLSIFNSSVAAVECLVEMQKSFQQDPIVPLRIGIHTGDITFSKEDVYGDGLNMASRIEAACIPGGVFISGKVYDDIKNHTSLCAKSVGQFKFKGIDDDVELYAMDCEGIAFPMDPELSHLRDSKAKIASFTSPNKSNNNQSKNRRRFSEVVTGLMALLLLFFIGNSLINTQSTSLLSSMTSPEQVSIAVLPFSNFSGDIEDEYFSNGITEDILTLLSNIKDFRVISRTSVMQYKDTEKSIIEIGKELNATHILEGSVRKSDDKVRIVAQLIDARNDTHLWADTYDREMTEIFEVQSDVAEQIAGTLKTELSPEDCQKIQRKPTDNLQAYEYYLQGRKYYKAYNKEDNDIAIQMFQKAISLDSSFAVAYAGLGDALGQKANFGEENPELLQAAQKMSNMAISLDENCSEGYKALGLSYHYQGDMDKALDAYNQAVEVNPNNDMAISNIALIYQKKGKIAEGIKWANKAKDLNPRHPMSFIRLSELYQSIGLDKYAESVLSEGIEWNPDNKDLNFKMANLDIKMNQIDDAIEIVEDIAIKNADSPGTFILRGKAAFYEKDYKQAQKHYLKAQELDGMMGHSKHEWEIDIGLAFVDEKMNADADVSPQLQELLKTFEKKGMKYPGAQNQIMMASIIAVLDEEEDALLHLRKANENGFLDYKMLENNPAFENLRGNVKFVEVLDVIRTKAKEIQKEVTSDFS